jgi:uncharacterized protein
MELGAALPLIAALALAGAVTGFLAGLFGIGGGSILVPVLYAAFEYVGVPESVRMHLTLGTSMAVIAPTGLRSFLAQHARGAADIEVLKRLAVPVFLGVLTGVVIASSISSEALRWVWVAAGTLVAMKLLLGRDEWRIGDHLPDNAWVTATAFTIGIISALMSIGGGIFLITLFTLYSFPLLNAIATSSGFGPIIAITGMLGYAWTGLGGADLPAYSIGYINWLAAGAIIPASLLTAPLGVRAAHALPKRKLEIAFALFLLAVVARFVWTLS